MREDKQALVGRTQTQFYFLPNLHDYTQPSERIMHQSVPSFRKVEPEPTQL